MEIKYAHEGGHGNTIYWPENQRGYEVPLNDVEVVKAYLNGSDLENLADTIIDTDDI